MSDPIPETFIVDCPKCKAKVAAIEHGCVRRLGGMDRGGDVFAGDLITDWDFTLKQDKERFYLVIT